MVYVLSGPRPSAHRPVPATAEVVLTIELVVALVSTEVVSGVVVVRRVAVVETRALLVVVASCDVVVEEPDPEEILYTESTPLFAEAGFFTSFR